MKKKKKFDNGVKQVKNSIEEVIARSFGENKLFLRKFLGYRQTEPESNVTRTLYGVPPGQKSLVGTVRERQRVLL